MTDTIDPNVYEPFIGHSLVEELRDLASSLEGKSWAHINSTMNGGGVAEMLRSLVPLARGLGLEAAWHVIRGNDGFFQVTKKFHDLLQGLRLDISTEEMFHLYLDTIAENAEKMRIASDFIVIHDPQPAALILSDALFGQTFWRCHIDTSAPNKIVWRFLLPYINHCSGAIFSMPEFMGPGLKIPAYMMTPCIDPLAVKNRQRTRDQALQVLEPLLKTHSIDPERPILVAVSRFDAHKNQLSILRAFRKLCEEKRYDPAPYLLLLGNTADDDPNGLEVLSRLKQRFGDDPDIRFWHNVENNDQVVGALMRVASGFLHLSTREGFGLVVSEALWQGTPVIGSAVGGIKKQVLEGETGFLVDPFDLESIAGRMAWILEKPTEAAAMGECGREHVRRHFLLPALVKKYLLLFRFHAKVSPEAPQFRINGLTHREIMDAIRFRHLILPNFNQKVGQSLA